MQQNYLRISEGNRLIVNQVHFHAGVTGQVFLNPFNSQGLDTGVGFPKAVVSEWLHNWLLGSEW